jgi:hypothetical protein
VQEVVVQAQLLLVAGVVVLVDTAQVRAHQVVALLPRAY